MFQTFCPTKYLKRSIKINCGSSLPNINVIIFVVLRAALWLAVEQKKEPTIKVLNIHTMQCRGLNLIHIIFPVTGTWIKWVDQISLDQKIGGSSKNELPTSGDLSDEEALIVPTAETVKQTFFLNLAMTHGFPLGKFNYHRYCS